MKKYTRSLAAYRHILKNNISPKRYAHSLRVARCAAIIARKLKLSVPDQQRCTIAGLLHDCARENSPPKQHSAQGAVIAQQLYGITDLHILKAIANHTFGAKKMSVIEKIIFIADYVEPARIFPLAKKIRRDLYKDHDLTAAVQAKKQSMLEYAKAKGWDTN